MNVRRLDHFNCLAVDVRACREFFQRTRRGEPQAKLYTRIDGREVLLFDPVALDPTGRTKIGSVVPNRDATRLAVGVFAQGTERQDYRIIDSTTGAHRRVGQRRGRVVRAG